MIVHPEHSVSVEPHPHSASVVQVENLGRGVYAVLVGGVILASLLAGMALMRVDALSGQIVEERTRHQASENAERSRHESAEADLRSRLESVGTEARMAEYYILELDGKLMAGGFVPPARGYGQWKQERKK